MIGKKNSFPLETFYKFIVTLESGYHTHTDTQAFVYLFVQMVNGKTHQEKEKREKHIVQMEINQFEFQNIDVM